MRGRRIGLLAHQASVDRRLAHAADLLGDLRGVKLAALLAPEHGLWGAPQDHALVAGNPARRRYQTQDRKRSHRLATTAFAYQAEELSTIEVKADVINRAHKARASWKMCL